MIKQIFGAKSSPPSKSAVETAPSSLRSQLMSGTGRKVVLGCAGAFVIAISGSTAARAENCVQAPLLATNVAGLPSFMASASNTIASAVTTTNSVFLTQSTALVGVPAGAQPDQTGGGVWARAVGGEVDLKSASTLGVTTTASGLGFVPLLSGPVACNDQVHSSFGGIQVGADVGNLNVNDWNVHYGVTAGSIGSRNNLVGGLAGSGAAFDSWTQVPFFGLYAALTNGSGFYADFLLRGDFYQANLNSQTLSLFNQNLNARGISVSGSTGYNYHIPNSDWFVEPSAGLIYSNVSVDPMSTSGPASLGGNVAGTLQINNIENTIGRLGLRAGTAFTIDNKLVLQPFAAVSVWHDFVGGNSSQYNTCPGCAFIGPNPALVSINYSGQNFGTYGQYSAGISGQLVDTGWLGFARFDYRNGDRLAGWDLTGGLRYQFTPQAGTIGRSVAKEPLRLRSTITASS
jgi:hypothetical protein